MNPDRPPQGATAGIRGTDGKQERVGNRRHPRAQPIDDVGIRIRAVFGPPELDFIADNPASV
jgi:hypothetical protein